MSNTETKVEENTNSIEKIPSETKISNGEKDYTYLEAIAIAAAAGEAFVLFYSVDSDSFVQSVSGAIVATLVALASLAGGAFAGFLFGIPRRLQDVIQSTTSENETANLARKLYSGN